MQKTIDPQPLYPRLFRIARPAAIFIGILLSLLAVYQWAITMQQVMQNPFAILPDDNWKVTQLQSALAGLSLPSGFFAACALVLTLLFNLAFLACGWLILWRRSQDWFGLYLGLILLLWANGLGVFYSTPPKSPWLANYPHLLPVLDHVAGPSYCYTSSPVGMLRRAGRAGSPPCWGCLLFMVC